MTGFQARNLGLGKGKHKGTHMIYRVIGTLTLALALSGCSDGISLNPANWFGPKSDVEIVVLEPEEGWEATVDYRGPVQQVTKLRVERATGGVIIHAVGVPPRQGYWDAELEPQNGEKPVKGVMTYTFKIAPPPWRTDQGAVKTREVNVAHYVSDIKLAGATRIRIEGTSNALTARR